MKRIVLLPKWVAIFSTIVCCFPLAWLILAAQLKVSNRIFWLGWTFAAFMLSVGAVLSLFERRDQRQRRLVKSISNSFMDKVVRDQAYTVIRDMLEKGQVFLTQMISLQSLLNTALEIDMLRGSRGVDVEKLVNSWIDLYEMQKFNKPETSKSVLHVKYAPVEGTLTKFLVRAGDNVYNYYGKKVDLLP